jgi:hypothetical protein
MSSTAVSPRRAELRQFLRSAGVQQFGRRGGQAPRERLMQLMDCQVPGEGDGIALHVGEHTW